MKQMWKSLVLVMVFVMAFGITSQAAVKKISITAPTKKDTYTMTLDKKNPKKTVNLKWKISTSGKTGNTVKVKSSNSKVVAVKKSSNTAASLTAKKAGKATITVYAGKKVKATLKVTVKQKAVSVKAKDEYVFIKKGKTAKIKATVSPKTATNKAVTYSSSKKSVASVDKNGKITGRKIGTATITVKAKGGKGVSTKVYVTVGTAKTKVKKVTATADKTSLYPGATAQITAKVSPKKVTNKKVRYVSTNKDVLTVSSTGKVTAKKAGTAKVKVIANDGSKKKKVITFTVNQFVESVALSQSSATLATSAGFDYPTTVTLTATVAPAKATNKNIVFTSSNPAVATVDGNGVVVAKSEGNAMITATAADGGKAAASCSVTVKAYMKKVVSIKAANMKVPYSTNVTIAWSNPADVLSKVNQLLGYAGGLETRIMTLADKQYTLSYNGSALSLKNAEGKDCLIKLINGSYNVNGKVQLASEVDVNAFNAKLAKLESQLGLVKPNVTFGSGTVTVNGTAYVFSNVTLKEKSFMFTMNGDRVVATLNGGKLEVVSEGSLDDALAALNAISGNIFE